jgi:hypothetical protein
MKKVVIILAALVGLLGTKTMAQSEYRSALQKGSMLVGGSLSMGFGNEKVEYSMTSFNSTSEAIKNSFSFDPTIAFLAGNGFAVGLAIDLTSETLKDKDDDSKETTTEYAIGPVLRYYLKSNTFFFGSLGFGKSIYKSSGSDGSDKYKGNRTLWSVGIGQAIFLGENVALEPSIAYQSNALKYDEGESDITYRDGQVVIGLGLSIYLRKNSNQ